MGWPDGLFLGHAHRRAREAGRDREQKQCTDDPPAVSRRRALPAERDWRATCCAECRRAGGVKVASDIEFALSEGADLVAVGKTAINTPDWPLRAVEPGFMPKPFPMTEAEAAAAGIAPPFMAMLREYHMVAPASADGQSASAPVK
jgi:hypothetical protein